MYSIIKADHALLPELTRFSADFFDEPWSKEAFEAEINKTNSAVFCAVLDGNIIGVVCIENQFGDGYLHNIAVDTEFRRQGIAKRLIKKCVEFIRASAVSKIYLEVRVSNTSAVSLYKKVGLTILTVRKKFYSCPEEDAYSMVLELQK